MSDRRKEDTAQEAAAIWKRGHEIMDKLKAERTLPMDLGPQEQELVDLMREKGYPESETADWINSIRKKWGKK